MINREDMLELTRRMTPSRHCFDRLAGAYMDGDGFVDGSFLQHNDMTGSNTRQSGSRTGSFQQFPRQEIR